MIESNGENRKRFRKWLWFYFMVLFWNVYTIIGYLVLKDIIAYVSFQNDSPRWLVTYLSGSSWRDARYVITRQYVNSGVWYIPNELRCCGDRPYLRHMHAQFWVITSGSSRYLAGHFSTNLPLVSDCLYPSMITMWSLLCWAVLYIRFGTDYVPSKFLVHSTS